MWSIHLSASQKKKKRRLIVYWDSLNPRCLHLVWPRYSIMVENLPFLKHLKYRPSGQFRLKAAAFVICPKQEPNPYFLLS